MCYLKFGDNMQIIKYTKKGSNKYELTLKDNKNIVNAIGFNLGSLASEYKIDDKIDVVGNLEINSFNGVDNIQINIKDLMKSL